MITIPQYFGAKPHSTLQEQFARELLHRVAALRDRAYADDNVPLGVNDPDTGTEISGSRGGNGDGGFRLPTATTGKALSSHKEAKAVDVYDPKGELDNWLTDALLEEYNLFREHPDSTPGWCHLTTRPPGSGKRTFQP